MQSTGGEKTSASEPEVYYTRSAVERGETPAAGTKNYPKDAVDMTQGREERV